MVPTSKTLLSFSLLCVRHPHKGILYNLSRAEQNGGLLSAINRAPVKDRVCVCEVTWSHCDFCSLWCIRRRLWGRTAQGNVMSSLRAEGEPSVAGSCPFYWVDVWGPGAMAQRVSALPPPCKHSTHTHTHTCLSILATEQGMPTHQLACVPARWGREAWVEANRDNQCALSCLSCSFMLSLSMRSLGAGVCVRHVCCLIGGKFHVTFRWRSVKGCFGV